MTLHHLSHSKLDLYKHSERCFYWRYVRHLQPKGDPTVPTHRWWGDVVHKALERILAGMSVDAAVADLSERGDLALIEGFDTKTWHTPERLHQVCSDWLESWQDDAERFEVLDQELWTSHPVPIEGIDIRWIAVLDVVLKDKEDGSIYIMDHKTTEKKVGSPWYLDQFNTSAQVTAYDWLGHELFGDKYSGLIINAIQSSTRIPFTNARSVFVRDPWQREEFLKSVEQLGVEAITLQAEALELLAGGNMEAAVDLFPHRDTYSENFCDYNVINNAAPELREEIISECFEPYNSRNPKVDEGA